MSATQRLPSATGGISRLACARATQAGLDPAPFLKQAGISMRQINDPHATIRVRDQIAFLNLVADAVGDDLLGFNLARACELRQLGLYYYVLASSQTLVAALRRAARYTSLVNEGVSQELLENGTHRMAFEYVGVSRHSDRHQIEFWLTALLRVCRQLVGRNFYPLRVQLVHQGQPSAELAAYFGNGLLFGADRDEIVFPLEMTRSPIVSADPYLNRLLISYCEEAMADRLGSSASFRSAVENAIAPLLPHGRVQIGEVARQIGVSSRTVARRLAAEGTTFTEVLDDLRANLADSYLMRRDFSISQIAWLLGYREVASFSSAFRRRTGNSPREVRRNVGARAESGLALPGRDAPERPPHRPARRPIAAPAAARPRRPRY